MVKGCAWVVGDWNSSGKLFLVCIDGWGKYKDGFNSVCANNWY